MSLSDYFEPVDYSRFNSNRDTLGKYSLGSAVKKTSDISLDKIDIAIFGVPFEDGKYLNQGESTPDRIRLCLYRLAALEKKLVIADLGNLRPATTKKGLFLALRDVIESLREAGVVTVVIGGSQELTVGICEAFKNERLFWFSAVDARLDIKRGTGKLDSANYLTQIFKNLPNLFHFSLIGYQNHLVGEKMENKTAWIGEHVRLGQIRDSITIAEPILRSTHFLTFDMGAVRASDAPAVRQKNPNGLFGEEACHLARYAGLSPELSVFGLFETGIDEKPEMQTPGLAAEIMWYFLEGVSQRKTTKGKTVYKVEIEGLEQPLVFLHDPESNRWWFEVRSFSGESIHVACSDEEYRQAAENEIPMRWLKFLQKMDRILK